MSIECLNQALKTDGLTPTKKFILVVLGNYADENGSCYPSYSHIAKIVGLKDSSGVKKTIKEFEKLGLLRIENRRSENGGFTSNRYHLTLGGGSQTHRVVETQREGVREPSNTKEDTKKYNRDFEEFWKAYPRKIAKKHAYKSFLKIKKDEWKKVIFASRLLAIEMKNTEERFIPHPTTWLNQERWTDAFETDENGELRANKNRSNLNRIAG